MDVADPAYIFCTRLKFFKKKVKLVNPNLFILLVSQIIC